MVAGAGMQRPTGVHMIYPALNLDMWLWTDGPRPVRNVTGSSMADETNGQSMASIVRVLTVHLVNGFDCEGAYCALIVLTSSDIVQ